MSKHTIPFGKLVTVVYDMFPKATSYMKAKAVSVAIEKGVIHFKNPAVVRRMLRELV